MTGALPGLLNEGEVVSINIVMTNVSETEVAGLAASVRGWDRENVQFLGGEAVFNYFNSVCVAPGLCFGGVQNTAGGTLVESEIGGAGPRVQFVQSYGLSPVSNIGVGVDQGLDDQVGTAMFTLRFTVLRPSQTTLFIDTFYPGDGIVLLDGTTLNASGPTVELLILPEPGTALLMGLGLAVLSSRRARRRVDVS